MIHSQRFRRNRSSYIRLSFHIRSAFIFNISTYIPRARCFPAHISYHRLRVEPHHRRVTHVAHTAVVCWWLLLPKRDNRTSNSNPQARHKRGKRGSRRRGVLRVQPQSSSQLSAAYGFVEPSSSVHNIHTQASQRHQPYIHNKEQRSLAKPHVSVVSVVCVLNGNERKRTNNVFIYIYNSYIGALYEGGLIRYDRDLFLK